MLENNEDKNKPDKIINPYQSFSNNYIFNSIPENNLMTQKKEEFMNFSFKKNYEKNNPSILTTNKDQRLNDLSIYSKNDKNIHKSGHFASNKNIKNKNNIKELKNKSKNLVKKLFNDSTKSSKNHMVSNDNKENLDISNYIFHIERNKDNVFVKINAKTKYINSIKKNENDNLFYEKLNKIKNDLDKYKSKLKINKNINCSQANKKEKKKIIKLNNNKLFISFKTNHIIKNKNIKMANNKSIADKPHINKSFDLNEKIITDKLFNKINHINKKLILFTEYNKKLKKQIKDLNKELFSIESNKSKRIIKSDKNKNYIASSPIKNRSTVFNSEIKNILFKKRIKIIKRRKNETSLHQNNNTNHNKTNSFNNISEFNITSNKKIKDKNKDVSRNEIYEKSIKKRRVKTNNIFECIDIKIV